MIRYSLDSKGRVQVIGLRGHITGEYELTNEPFSMHDAFDWRKDIETNTWIFDPIINIPMIISKLQAVKQLLAQNQYTQLIDGLNNDPTGESKILFDAASEIHIESKMTQDIALILNISPTELNDFFVEASKHLIEQ